ncbi:hypothetical protein Chy1_0061 [Mycobacterium phage Chy1]|uniref:Uncharacterized protein n=1 Tax=Mycobacterium phage Chy1 TaxID=1219531 RepID=R4JEN3_BPMD2|nr:hypothetical protein M179_gp61 [Mycobacterium phage Chy4]AGK85828.1 hypothetical protein Chy1_0061 [Mycobacterium phage Chy1]AGK86023.1 hypothetical protein Chy4_0061 [Mycobacterium phage Chy4]
MTATERNTQMTTPNAMPRKANPLHQQVLGALIKTRPTVWTHKAIDPESPDPKKPRVIETKVHGREVTGLARNVSEENVDRLAKRWIK